MSRTVLIAILLLIVALYVRVAGGFALFISGTVILGIAIAIGNVVLPSYVKWRFPMQVGLATGLYTATMNFTAGLGGGLSYPLSETGLGFRLSLACWGIFAIAALILWIPLASKGAKQERVTTSDHTEGTSQNAHVPVTKSKLAWLIALTMGFLYDFLYGHSVGPFHSHGPRCLCLNCGLFIDDQSILPSTDDVLLPCHCG